MQNILIIVCLFPLLGVALIALLARNKGQDTKVKWIANIVAFLGFVVSLPLIIWFNSPQYINAANGMRFVVKKQWIPTIGAEFHVGIDGISLLLILLTTLMGFIAILSSWTAITKRVPEYYCYFLILQAGMLGVFIALDFVLFYVFFLYTLAGSVLLLLGILALYFFQYQQTGVWSFDVLGMRSLGLPLDLQWWIFLAFFIGFAIKVPMFPFHTWLPDAHVEAPTAGSVILAAVLLKMGTYGFVRFSLPILPEATMQFLPWMMLLAVIGIIYGALTAMMQKDMKKLVAYSSVSHLGFCMLGVFVVTPVALEGGILQMINHGISTGALFLIVGILYERRHTRLISDYGGISNNMPVYATVFLIMTMSSIGLPTLNGFVGEVMILMGVFADPANRFWAVAGVIGIVLGAAYMLWLYQRVMFGENDNPKNQGLTDLTSRELATFVPLIVLAFWIGLYPKTFLQYLHDPVNEIVEIVRPGEFPAISEQNVAKA